MRKLRPQSGAIVARSRQKLWELRLACVSYVRCTIVLLGYYLYHMSRIQLSSFRRMHVPFAPHPLHQRSRSRQVAVAGRVR